MSTPQPAAGASFATSVRILAGALMGALVMIGLALAFVLPTDGPISMVVLGAQVLAGVIAHVLLETIGYRTPPLETTLADAQANAKARLQWQTTMIMRFVFAEVIAIASIAAAFVLPEGNLAVYLGGAVVSLILMAVHVWPWSRPVGKIATALESGGKASGLREDFGFGTSGPIQQL